MFCFVICLLLCFGIGGAEDHQQDVHETYNHSHIDNVHHDPELDAYNHEHTDTHIVDHEHHDHKEGNHDHDHEHSDRQTVNHEHCGGKNNTGTESLQEDDKLEEDHDHEGHIHEDSQNCTISILESLQVV